MAPPILLLIAFVKNISAFRAEFRRIMWIFGSPSAFVAPVKWRTLWLRFATILTEFTRVHRATPALPARCGARLRLSAILAESSRVMRSALTVPGGFSGYCGPCRLAYHGILSIVGTLHKSCHSAHHITCHTHAQKSCHCAVFICSSSIHSLSSCTC